MSRGDNGDDHSTKGLLRAVCNILRSNGLYTQDAYLPMFCIIAIRDKIVIHQDYYRQDAFKVSSSGEFSIVPIRGPADFSYDDDKVQEIMRLKSEYENTISDLSPIVNPPSVLEHLFYNVPAFKDNDNNYNPDRKKIEKLMETGGCESYKENEVMVKLDNFIINLLDAIPKVSW